MKSILTKLNNIQTELVVAKTKNVTMDYNSRSCEAILTLLKPFLIKYMCVINLTDQITCFEDNSPLQLFKMTDKYKNVTEALLGGNKYYMKATATIYCCETGESLSACAEVQEEIWRKGQDSCKKSGTASSYVRKYALGGLLGLDDRKDNDLLPTDEPKPDQDDKSQKDKPIVDKAPIPNKSALPPLKVNNAPQKAVADNTPREAGSKCSCGKIVEAKTSKANKPYWKCFGCGNFGFNFPDITGTVQEVNPFGENPFG
ncbi:ERF family protein [Candidatus Pacearchaeota archaeon]|nr:ERF family protein [Candidatus Pacearchaeota archaeon]